MASGLLKSSAVRGLQWWNSAPLGDPDGMVWTDVRTLRRMRAVRTVKRVKLVVALVLATALGTVLALALADVRSSPPALTLHSSG